MFLSIIANGTLFVTLFSGEIMREEKDSLGREFLPEDAVYGIHSFRSSTDFHSSGKKINTGFVKAYLLVKKITLRLIFSKKLVERDDIYNIMSKETGI